MKFLVSFFLLLPSLVMAQPPAGEGMPVSFEEFKKAMLPAIEASLPAMEKNRECISKAGSKEDVKKCMQEMAARVKAMQEKLGLSGGDASPPEVTEPPKGFVWNEANKTKMLKMQDQSIKMNKAMLECLQSTGDADAMNNCMSEIMSEQ